MRTRHPMHLTAGLAALLGLAVLVIGVPAGLVAWKGDPLPRTVPHLADLNHPMTLEAIARCVAILLWLAWAQFAVAVIAEIRYQWPGRHQHTAGHPTRNRQLPLTGPSGSLAGRLVALALLLTAASAAILPNADAATAAHSTSTPAPAHTVATAPVTVAATTAVTRAESTATSTQTDAYTISNIPGIPVSAKYYTVVRYDSLWRIADECLGNGQRYDEIFQLNKGRTQPDGQALTERSLIQPGWHLIMPGDAAHCELATAADTQQAPQPQAGQYTVGTGDDLSGIAWKEYHDPADWTLIYHANANEISNPNLIYPGQILDIPAAPGQSATPASASSTNPQTPTPGPAGGTGQTTTPGASTPTTSPAATATPSQTSPTTSRSPSPDQTGQHATASPAPTSTSSTPSGHQSTQASAMTGERTLWELLGISGLAAAAVVTTLDLRRRRQQRARREGEYIKMPQPGPTPTGFEMILRSGNDADAGAWMSQVLRAAAANAAASGTDLPDLRMISLGPDVLYVQTTRPTTPIAPFAAAEDWWVCPRETPLPPLEALADIPAPYPALVTVGHDEHGRAVLLDLESIRSLAVPGPVGLGALRAIALELLGQIPADELTVTLVGVGIELADADLPASLNLAIDLDAAIEALEDWVAFAAEQLTACGADSVRAARLAAVADAPVTHVVISAEDPTPEQAERLARVLSTAPAMCAAVITGTPVPVSGPAWVLPATGAPEILAPTGIRVTGQYLTDTAYAELLVHFEVSADLESTPTPGWSAQSVASDADESSGASDADVHGPDDDLTEYGIEEAAELEDSDPAADTAVAGPTPPPAATGSGGTGARFAAFPVSVPAPSGLAESAAIDAPQVLVLGQIQLVGARGSVESSRASKLRELAAYIVLNSGASATELTEAVWPQGTTQKNRNTSANKLRSWLGRDEAGEPFFPLAYGGYRLASSVSCDLLEFSAHYARGVRARTAGEDQEAASAFEAALALVRGRPFAGAEPRRYGWAEPVLQQTVSEIVDAVRYLARMRMAEGDWMAAATISAWGMGIGPEHESLFRLRFEAVYRMGDQAELDRLSTTLQTRLEDMGMSMQLETRELLEELLDKRTATLRQPF